MDLSQMCITQIIVIIWYHFIGSAFKTHTFVASAACNSETPISSYYWHFTVFIRTNTYSIFLHVLSE